MTVAPIPSGIKYIICICIGILLMWSMKGCGDKSGAITSVIERIDTVTTIDTTYITRHKIVYKTKFKYDSVIIHDTTKLELCRYERTYRDTLRDSLLTIISTDSIIGSLKSKKISYSLALPTISKTTTIRDSVFISKNVIPRWHKLANPRVAVGGGFIGFIFGIAAIISLTR